MAINISTLHLNASIQKVWDTITQPALVKLWQYGSDLQTTWEVGSDIKFSTQWGETRYLNNGGRCWK